MTPNPAIFAPILIAALAFFGVSCYRRFSLVTLGKPEDRFHSIGKRIGDMLLFAFGQRRVVQKPFGINHFVIFWAFMVLLLANGEFLVRGVFPQISLALLPAPLYHGLLFAFDLVSLLTLGSIALAFARRLFFPPPYMETRYVKAKSFEAFLILSFIALLMLAYFGLHGAEIALGEGDAAAYMPFSSFVAGILATATPAGVAAFGVLCWWGHA
ncbi:MAG TPA: electron transfer flavoprotein, partial [Geobacteraceae bacterium]|nr:electron transfer flavoprotein [Geobacteraceae bacterium]